jgi:pilus assembly protein CpaB
VIRIIGAIVAVILVVVGGLAIFLYVQDADTRAAQGQKLVPVYVVQTQIPKGTSGASIGSEVKVEKLPADAIQPGSVTSLASIQNKLANTDLLPGDQLVQARFSSADELAAGGSVPVPKGLQTITVAMPAPEVVGGDVHAGDRVGIVYTGPSATGGTVTQFLYQQVLVTGVSYGTTAVQQSKTSESTNASAQSAGVLMVTFAVTDVQATKIAFAAQQGNTLWLTLQNTDTTSGSPQVTVQNVFQ